SEKAEDSGEGSIFRLVDEITTRIKSRFEIKTAAEELDRDLREVTTGSVEAYREYAEGIRLHERFLEEDAVPHFQRAIELDPEFAMALAKLGVVMSNLGLHEEADEYAERALEHVDRLSERERFYIEGWYASRKPETLDQAVDFYERALEVYPDHGSARHNLANILFATERYEEAIEQFEELRRRGMLFPATYEQLASAYKTLDDLESAREVLQEYSSRNPDDWNTVLALAQLEIEAGDLEEGSTWLSRAEALGAAPYRIDPVRWEAHVLREEWDEAMETASSLMESEGGIEKFIGGRLIVTTGLYRGDVDQVLSGLDRYLASRFEGGRDYRTQPLLLKARVLLETGEFQKAREAALGIADTQDTEGAEGASHQALAIAAIAAQSLGDDEEADRLRREYRHRIDPALGARPQRLYHFLEGELAMARGDYEEAISQFEESESMLPPRGSAGVHTVIWYSLATAHRLAGNQSEATDWYERIVESTEERLFEPIRYVRSFYYLGELYQADDEPEEARRNYQRFLDHWEDGDVDRDLVSEARSRVR
ncbi:MAG: tetratricopeptide repeat protein, partial [Vicinamibacteria bacterium]